MRGGSNLLAPAVLLAAILGASMLASCGQAGQAQRSGAELYANHCASCHGAQGEGDGPVAAVMKVGVPNLRNVSLRNSGEFPADAVRAFVDGRNLPAAHGDRYMPIWGNEFGYGAGNGAPAADTAADDGASAKRAAERIDAIVEYVRSLQYR